MSRGEISTTKKIDKNNFVGNKINKLNTENLNNGTFI